MNEMKIKVGHIYLNQSKKYILPIIKHYGSTFTSYISHLFKLAVGIGDYTLEACGINHNTHIYILVDVDATPTFLQLLYQIQNSPAYETDYAFDTIHKGHLHMIVLKIPTTYLHSLEMFKESKYSQMFTEGQINILFNPVTEKDSRKKVLMKAEDYRIKFIEKIADAFDVPIETVNLSTDSELDFSIINAQELFNQHLKKENERWCRNGV